MLGIEIWYVIRSGIKDFYTKKNVILNIIIVIILFMKKYKL